jgi:HAD superfamily hydrolase (TIGR01509 family)
MLRALVFDFDGLILDTESSFIEAYAAVHARHGVPFDREPLRREAGYVDYTFDPWHAFGKAADRAALNAERRERNRELNLLLPIRPGLVPLLDDAQAAGLHLGVASNETHAHVEGHLGRVGLLPRFEFIACREDAASPKPEPDIYRLVLNRFGLRGSEAVAFEDSPIGTLAAKRAGMWVIAVPNETTAECDFTHAHWRAKSLEETPLAELRTRFER